MTVKISALQQ